MVVFDIRPMENHLVINDMQKVSSAYTKTNDAVFFVQNSFVMYADKKRATSLLRTIGFQMPIELLQGGFTGSITYNKQNVNLYGEKFSDVFRQNSTGNEYSREMDPVEALEEQVKLLRKQKEYWKNQTKRTDGKKADSQAVRKLVLQPISNKKREPKKRSPQFWSEWRDSNPRPHGPEPCAIPNFATPR